MSNNLKSKKVVLFGTGKMGLEYSKVLRYIDVDLTVVGRSIDGVEKFCVETGIQAVAGGFTGWRESGNAEVEFGVVAVSVEELAELAVNLMDFGIRNILLEKPAGLNAEEIRLVKEKAAKTGTTIVVGYNRRFYASVQKAQEIIKKDGGARSFHFEFTEWLHQIPDHFKPIVRQNWFLANSTHVVDLAFFLGGKPKELAAFTSGSNDGYSPATVFSGSGISQNDALFTYMANWQGPGRWGVEVITDHHRLIFRPIEKLQVQLNKSIAIEFVEIDDQIDIDFKPGLYKQTRYFLDKVDHPNFVTIDHHYDNVVNYYQEIVRPGSDI